MTNSSFLRIGIIGYGGGLPRWRANANLGKFPRRPTVQTIDFTGDMPHSGGDAFGG